MAHVVACCGRNADALALLSRELVERSCVITRWDRGVVCRNEKSWTGEDSSSLLLTSWPIAIVWIELQHCYIRYST